MKNCVKGFSLIEIIAALAILAIVTGIALPFSFRSLDTERERLTISEMQEIHQAIVGNPELGTYGFLGDMGKLPDNLIDLIKKPTGISDFNHDHTNRVGMGWKGPYLSSFSEDDLRTDEWGTLYQYSSTGINAGQVISAGPDRDINTIADNITYPADGPVKTTGNLFLTIFVNGIAEPAEVTVYVYSTDNGNESATVLTKTTGSDGRNYPGFYFHDLKHGIHAVKATHSDLLSADATGIIVSRTVNVGIREHAQKNYKIYLGTAATSKLKI